MCGNFTYSTIVDGVTGDPTAGLGSMFNDPQLIQKLASNPKTSQFLADPAFMQKLNQMRQNPAMTPDLFSDPRMIQVLGVLMGVDMSMGMPGDAAGAAGSQAFGDAEEDVEMPDVRPSKPQSKEESQPVPDPEPEPEDEEAIAAKKAKEEADNEKKLGTEEYKKRNFDQAIAHYSKAWDLHKDITYLNNLGAAKFEKGDYEGAIKACTDAIEYGREV